MQYIILLIITTILYTQDWNYSADILEKKVENNRDYRIFKSSDLSNNQVHIYNDTISIFTNQAKQYIDTQELHLIGPVTMINGLDSLTCKNMIFWYERDSLHAFGDVDFQSKNSYIETDSLMYVKTNGFRGYSFTANHNSKFYDQKYEIKANQIKYDDYTQEMDLNKNVEISSKDQGALGSKVNVQFKDSLIKNMLIQNNAYVFNNHYAFIDKLNYQLFKDEINGNQIKVDFNKEHLKNIFVQGMAESTYYVVNDSTELMGFNEASGDTMLFNYLTKNLETIYISGDARGIFYPEKNKTKLDSLLEYKANKIDYHINQQITLLNDNVTIKYQNTELTSDTVNVNWDNNMLYAYSTEENSSQIKTGSQKPIIGENLEFDLINKKGIIKLGETTVRDGIYKSKVIFREEPNIYHMSKSIYTTCDHENPHYYFKSPKMKMIQGERIITKPLYLYIQDILVLGIPFAILPSTNSARQSGWIMPSFGVSNNTGTYFQKLGYYWAPNDYLDETLLIDFYDKDRIEIRNSLRYIKRYNFNGSIKSTFKRKLKRNITNDINDLFTNKSTQNFDIRWTHNHQIDPTQNLNVNWIYVTSSDFYNDSYDLNTRTQQKLESAAGYSKVWSAYNNRLSLSLSESYDLNKEQNPPPVCSDQNQDGLCDSEDTFIEYYKTRVLPNLRFSHSNSKLFGNGDKWYNSIYYNFSSKFTGHQKIGHVLHVNETTPITSDWSEQDTIYYNSNITHNTSLSAPIKLFGWLNINPGIRLTEGWIFKYNDNGQEKEGFKRRLTGNFSLSSSTTIYGLFPINNFYINSIRHILSPTISFNYSPDFSKPILGVNLGYFDKQGNDYFYKTMIGSTPTNEIKKINISLTNNFQMKLNDSLDTKFDFLKWNINTGYNFMADSLNLDVIKSRLKINILNDFDFDFTMWHDPYMLDNNLRRLNKYADFPILTYLQGSTDIRLIGKNYQGKNTPQIIDSLDTDETTQLYNSNNIFEPEINQNTLWEVDLRIGAKLQKDIIQLDNENKIGWDKTLWIQPLLKLKLTEKWKLTYTSQIDLMTNQIISHNMYFYRPLHCWEFGLKWWPSGSGSGFLLNIRVKSPNLQDIKVKSSGGRLFGL